MQQQSKIQPVNTKMASAITVPKVKLNSGYEMPVIGMGTGGERKLSKEEIVEALVKAVGVGYRHFDTAALYGSEPALGKAIAEAVDRGIVDGREEFFVTSKVWCTDNHPDLVLPALKKTLQNLGLEYLDLYLIHWPVRLKHGEFKIPFPKEDILPFEMKETWAAMEECQRLGLVRSIGVSNFSSKKLEELLKTAAIPPAVNQVEMNTSWHQTKLRNFCSEKGIHITAWSPLGAWGSPWGSLEVKNSQVLKEIADAKGKSVPQIALRWLYEQGVSAVVKSFNEERMKQNLQIFDWELSEEDRKKIDAIPQVKGYKGLEHVSPNGPYTSLEELWDGEI